MLYNKGENLEMEKISLYWYNYYAGVAKQIFPYCVKIADLKYIEPDLEIMYSNWDDKTVALNRTPGHITIFIDNIVAEQGGPQNRMAIISMLFIVLEHELAHTEQFMNQQMYNSDPIYAETIEDGANRRAYEVLSSKKKEIDYKFGINLSLDYFNVLGLNMNAPYTRIDSVGSMYMSLFLNVIIRNERKFNEMRGRFLDKYFHLAISVYPDYNFLIKRNGEFCAETLPEFIRMCQDKFSKYGAYTVKLKGVLIPYRDTIDPAHPILDGVYVANIEVSEQVIYPIDMKDIPMEES